MPHSPSAQTADQLVQAGLVHHQAGRLDKANEAYQQALQLDAEHPDALHLLGMLAHQVGDHAFACDLIHLAIHATPANPIFHCNLGTVLQAQGKIDEAIASFNQAILIDPNNAVFHFNLGRALQAQGMLHDAADSYRAALALSPNHIESLSNLGLTLLALHEPEEAADIFRRALGAAPGLAEMHFNLGLALNAQGKFEAAIESYRNAIAVFGDFPQAHCNLGAALLTQGKIDEAVNSYRRAIASSPGFTEAHYNLGISLQAQGNLDEAIASYRRTLELQPNFIEGYCNLGNALRAQGLLDKAVECYQHALAIKPDYATAYSNLLFLHSYHGTQPAAEYLAQARGWEQACVPQKIRRAARAKTFTRAPLAGRRLKIGYISGDFRKHAVSYFIEQIFAEHDRERVVLYAYSNNRTHDEVTERLSALADHWRPISGMSDTEVCEHMAVDRLDVLIDLSGHSAHNRLGVFARRVAPVQATYLYFASTGLTEMDYWIGDEILTPPALDEQFSEQVWRLPRTWMSYKTIAEAPVPNWWPAAPSPHPNPDGTTSHSTKPASGQVAGYLPQAGEGAIESPSDALSNSGSIWLGSFNNLGKITPQTLRLWAQILHALPEGRLLLKNKDLADAGNRQRILNELAALGIVAERIDLQPGSDWADYMAQHDRLDIALDPVGGHGGGTSTCDALWMGVPVIHLQGDHVGSRFAATLLHAIGHDEWIAHTEAEYLEKTIALARDVPLRQQLRSTQRDTMANSPLCDARGLARTLEDAYADMFERWLKRNTP